MLTWWLYSIVVAALIGAAALAAERALRISGLAMRWVWAVAMLTSVSITVIVALLSDRSAPLAVSDLPSPSTLVVLPAIAMSEAGIPWERWAAAGWVVVSMALAFGVLACALLLARRRRGWSAGELDGAPVLWSADTGPAVVGLRRPQIVVPRWAADLPEPLRRLLLAHEREHIAAKDPVLFHALLALVIALPWNVALWWQLRRLRAAMELDCDARVLRAGADRRSYADLLMSAAEHFAAATLPELAFAWWGSLLRRRLRLLAPRRARYARVQIAVAGAMAVVLVVQACGMRPMDGSGAPGSILEPELPASTVVPDTAYQLPPLNIKKSPVFTPYTVRPELVNRGDIAKALVRFYPPLLREAGIGGTALVWFLIDETGNVLQTQVQKSSGREELDAAALRIAQEMEFKPAKNRGEPVKVWVALPIVFGSPADAPVIKGKRIDIDAQPPAKNLEDGPVFTPMTVYPQLTNAEHVIARLKELYPPLLRGAGIGGEAKVWMLIDESGKVAKAEIQQSSGRDELDAAALRLTEEMQFSPGQNKGKTVKAWVALPIVFDAATE